MFETMLKEFTTTTITSTKAQPSLTASKDSSNFTNAPSKGLHAQFEQYDANTEGLGLRVKDSEQLGR